DLAIPGSNSDPHVNAGNEVLVSKLIQYSPTGHRVRTAEDEVDIEKRLGDVPVDDIRLQLNAHSVRVDSGYVPACDRNFWLSDRVRNSSHNSIEVGGFDHIRVDKEKAANTQVGELLRHNRTRSSQADHANLQIRECFLSGPTKC